jgi:hypothetical protein
LDGIGVGEYATASGFTKKVWLFLGKEVYPRLSKDLRKFISGSVKLNVKRLLECITASDEALCILILDVKIEEFMVWIAEGGETVEAEANSHGNKKKRRRVAKKKVIKRDDKAIDLVARQSCYNKYIKAIGAMRNGMAKQKGEDGWTDGHSWYSALVGQLVDETGDGMADDSSSASCLGQSSQQLSGNEAMLALPSGADEAVVIVDDQPIQIYEA